MKILTIFGTRPEAIKLFPVLHALAAEPGVDSRVCVTAQHREMLDQVLEIGGIVPDHDLDIMTPGQSLDALTARLLTAIGEVMDAERPDRVIVQGDTATAMVGALAAYYRKIPVGHVEAGLRSFNRKMPEEINRIVADHISDALFAPTETAMKLLAKEGIPASNCHLSGDIMFDAALSFGKKAKTTSNILSQLKEAVELDNQEFNELIKGK